MASWKDTLKEFITEDNFTEKDFWEDDAINGDMGDSTETEEDYMDEDAVDQEAMDLGQEQLDDDIAREILREKVIADNLEADAKDEADPIESDETVPEREKELVRELKAEALTRLENAARTLADFKGIIEEWDRRDRNRERRERYHEITRSGDTVPLDKNMSANELIFPHNLSSSIIRQMQKGDFNDAIFYCPYEIHELVSTDYFSEILLELPEDSKELVFLWAICMYSTEKIAFIRGAGVRNVRKIRNTLFQQLQRKLFVALIDVERQEQSMTLSERKFLSDYQEYIDRPEGTA